MSIIPNLAHRKQKQLTKADIPDGTIAIGDAAFSLCPLLKQVTIPASVEHIGVAAFCGSGIKEATFLGVPKEIEPSVFAGCKKLVRIVVPKGTKEHFAEFLPMSLLQEVDTKPVNVGKEPQYNPQPGRVVRQLDMFVGGQTFVEHPNLFSQLDAGKPNPPKVPTQQTPTDLFGQPIKKTCSLTYNFHDFTWTKGDKVDLNVLFSGPTALTGDPSYQFRRKFLFVFMKSTTAAKISPASQYSIPANTTHFTRKYKEKYGSRQIRIILFVCNDGHTATFFDEVRYATTGNNTITVKSVL